MNKQTKLLPMMALAVIILLSACSKKSNTQGRYVPANATAAMLINGASLNEKLPWSEIKNNQWFAEMQQDTTLSAFTKKLLDNPENSGVNTKKDFILFYVTDTTGAYGSVQGTLTDAAKFKTALQEASKNGKETVADGYTYYTDDNTCVAYNKEKFFVSMELGDYNNLANVAPISMDSTTEPYVAPAKKVDVLAKTKALIAMAEDNTLAKNEKFSELMATKGDAHIWINAEYANNANSLGSMAAVVNLSKLYKGAISTATLNFDNGAINMDVKSYAGKEMTELYEKYSGGKIDKTMLQSIPSQNVAGLFAFNFKPEGVKAFVKLLNLDGMLNLGAAQAGFNLDDFVKANKGDILLAVTDLGKDSVTKQQDAKVLFAASIGDKPSFTKIIDAGKKYGAAVPPDMGKLINYNINDTYFAMSNDKNTTQSFLAGGTKANNAAFMDKILGSSFGGYANLQYIIKNIPTSNDTLDIAEQNLSLKMWDNVIINGGGYSNKSLSQHWEINLMDKSTNSLKQLNAYTGAMAIIEKKKAVVQAKFWNDTEVEVAPPVAERTIR